MAKSFLLTAAKLLKATIRELAAYDFLRMAGATAFFASFALPPILIIIVRTLGLFMNRRELGRQLGQQLTRTLGAESTGSILQAIRSFRALQHNYLLTGLIFLFLLFLATTLFRVIKNSVNEIWNVRKRPQSRLASGLKSRILSLAVMLMAGVLFLAVQTLDAGRHLLGRYLMTDAPGMAFADLSVSGLIVVGLSTVWFYVLFLWLPDGKPYPRIALFGALVTSILFNAGKWVLQGVLDPVQVHRFYGSSGALVLLLLFVFYCAIILYFGVAFTKVWGDYRGRPVRLKAHAVRYRLEDEQDA